MEYNTLFKKYFDKIRQADNDLDLLYRSSPMS